MAHGKQKVTDRDGARRQGVHVCCAPGLKTHGKQLCLCCALRYGTHGKQTKKRKNAGMARHLRATTAPEPPPDLVPATASRPSRATWSWRGREGGRAHAEEGRRRLDPTCRSFRICAEPPTEPAPAATTISCRHHRHLWKQTVRKGRREGGERESGRLAPTDQAAWTPSSTSPGRASISRHRCHVSNLQPRWLRPSQWCPPPACQDSGDRPGLP
jgi:hypothetical protein